MRKKISSTTIKRTFITLQNLLHFPLLTPQIHKKSKSPRMSAFQPISVYSLPNSTLILLTFWWLYTHNYSILNLKWGVSLRLAQQVKASWSAHRDDTQIYKFIQIFKAWYLPWHLCTDEQVHSLCCFSENTHSRKKGVSFLARKIYPWIASLYFLVSSTVMKRKGKKKQSQAFPRLEHFHLFSINTSAQLQIFSFCHPSSHGWRLFFN